MSRSRTQQLAGAPLEAPPSLQRTPLHAFALPCRAAIPHPSAMQRAACGADGSALRFCYGALTSPRCHLACARLCSLLAAVAHATSNEKFGGQGWSLSFPTLRQLLQGAAERLLAAEESGTNASGVQHAIEIGRAVELPTKRLEAARSIFDESQAKLQREKMSMKAELRRKQKEEELVVREAARKEEELLRLEATRKEAEEASPAAAAKRQSRKERLPGQAPLPGPEAAAGPEGVAAAGAIPKGSADEAHRRGSKQRRGESSSEGAHRACEAAAAPSSAKPSSSSGGGGGGGSGWCHPQRKRR